MKVAGAMPATNPLLSALATLVETVEPSHADRILKHCIRLLIEDGTARRIGSKKDAEAWSSIRGDLRAAMQADGLTAMQLAQRIGLSESTVDKCSAPAGPVPSEAIIGKIRGWLDSRKGSLTAIRDGAVPNGRNGKDTSPAAPTRLSDGDRQRLADRTEGMADKEIRERLGVDQNCLDRLVIGRPVPPEAIAKARAFLAAPG
jgi:hypothetical protein